MTKSRVLIAPDSFKGSLAAVDVAAAIREGWLAARPHDEVDTLPLADGGEGTISALHAADPGSTLVTVPGITGPDGRPVEAQWLRLTSGVAVVEMAQTSGLPLITTLDPMGATTRGLGDMLRVVFGASPTEVWVGLGGSASTDGGVGALRALGASALDSEGDEIGEGGAELARLSTLDLGALIRPGVDVVLLSDVTSPLLGPHGAAAVFAPQKGADPDQVRQLDAALATLATIMEADPTVPGSGAAGGTAFGLRAALGASIRAGADVVAEASGLKERIASADVVITGEGSFDLQSTTGKLVGNVLRRTTAAGTRCMVIAGIVKHDPHTWNVSLTQLAGSVDAAIRDPARWCTAAGSLAANEFSSNE